MWIWRSCASTPSTSGPRRSNASSSMCAIGSSDRLPLLMTSGRATSAISRWCSGVYGSIRPRSAMPGATPSATAASRPACGRARWAGEGGELGRSVRSRAHRGSCHLQVRHHEGERLVVPAPFAGEAPSPPPGWWRRPPGGSRRCPSSRRSQPARSASTTCIESGACLGRDGRPSGRRRRSAGRRRDRRWAERGSVGRPGRRTLAWHSAHIMKPAMVVARPVVGDREHDRVAGPAVGAVRERVAVPAVVVGRRPRPGTRRRWRCRR